MTAGKGKSGLNRGRRLFRRRKYAEVISLLEPQVFIYRENPDYFELLGLSCLYTGDYAGAYSYLRRVEQMEPERLHIINALAAVALRRRETEEALRLWLKVLDQDSRNRIARRGLDFLRSSDDPAQIISVFEEGKGKKFLPPEPVTVPLSVWVFILLAGVLALATVTVPPLLSWIEQQRGEPREGVELVELPREGERLATEGEFRLILTEDELASTLRRAREYFNEYRDNLAQREINRILASNASVPLKERARLLEQYLREPDFTSFDDNFGYSEVAEESWLYRNTYVRWSGTASNIEFGEEQIRFDFLVGYQDRRVLEGVVPAYLEFAALLDGGEAIEVIAEVELPEDEPGFALRVTSIRKIAPRGE
ncbi:MAG: tetratricopeptide repeat protein [Spirochaetaceae bacterium]